MKKHVNIPIFIPHLGCPNQCVFCNQRSITGHKDFDPESVVWLIEEALSTIPNDTEKEIAFFGGSFTGIDYALMCRLLDIAYSYVKTGRVASIRCSTRPDYINEKILDKLKASGVSVIELGLQSIDENVLKTCKRGHTFIQEKTAVKMIKERGFSLVGQMMIGLPGSTLEKEKETTLVEDIIRLLKIIVVFIVDTVKKRIRQVEELSMSHTQSEVMSTEDDVEDNVAESYGPSM